MSSLGQHLVKRSIQAAQDHFSSPGGYEVVNPADEPQDGEKIKALAIWGIVLVWVTAILYLAMMSAVSTTYPSLDDS